MGIITRKQKLGWYNLHPQCITGLHPCGQPIVDGDMIVVLLVRLIAFVKGSDDASNKKKGFAILQTSENWLPLRR
jgi:hypothetical protein